MTVVRLPEWNAAAYTRLPSGLTASARGVSANRVTTARGAVLSLFAGVRSLQPDVFGAEKYMDFAFFNTLIRTDHLPPQDPWMSGVPINYYYFGYLMFANLLRLAPLAGTIGYNLCVATVGGLAFSQTAWVVLALTGRWGLGVLGGCMSAFLGNLDGAWQFLEKGTLRGMDYWRSSRVVAKGDTINEFPFFTFLYGDPHAHLIALPFTLLALVWAFSILKGRWEWSEGRGMAWGALRFCATLFVGGLVIGLLRPANTWDMPAYLGLGALAWTVLALLSASQWAVSLAADGSPRGIGRVIGLCDQHGLPTDTRLVGRQDEGDGLVVSVEEESKKSLMDLTNSSNEIYPSPSVSADLNLAGSGAEDRPFILL